MYKSMLNWTLQMGENLSQSAIKELKNPPWKRIFVRLHHFKPVNYEEESEHTLTALFVRHPIERYNKLAS